MLAPEFSLGCSMGTTLDWFIVTATHLWHAKSPLIEVMEGVEEEEEEEEEEEDEEVETSSKCCSGAQSPRSTQALQSFSSQLAVAEHVLIFLNTPRHPLH